MNAYFRSRWAPSLSGAVDTVRAPYLTEPIDTVPICDERTVDFAIRDLRDNQPAFESFAAKQIGAVFGRTSALLRRQTAELSTLISREQGKPLRESADEVVVTANLLESFASESFRLGRQFQPLAVEARVGERFGFTRQRPSGVEAILSPNTFPLLIPAMLITPALAAGNVVILKPASATPLSALRLLGLFLEAGLPPWVIACLTGPGEVTGQAICRHPMVDLVCCYGGMDAIHAIRTAVGLIPIHFHHGGMAICAVAADADLALAVRCIVAQGFENAGQTAISAGAVYVEAPVYDEFVQLLAGALQTLMTGNPLAPGTRIGPLTEQARAERACRIVRELLARGGRLVLGTGQNEGSLLAPTLIGEVRPDDASLFPVQGNRELLSPIMGVIRVEEGLKRIIPCLDRRTQPAVAIFTRDLERASSLASEMPVFNVHVNGIPTWRDGVIFTSQSSTRLGRSQSEKRVQEVSTQQDIVFHPA